MVSLSISATVRAMMRPRVAIALIFGTVTVFAIWWLVPRSLPEVVICEKVVPGSTTVGLKLGRAKDGGVDVGFDSSITKTEANAEALHSFLECIKEQNAKKSVNLEGGVDLPKLEPLGEVADHWKGDSDLTLSLMPGSDDVVLNNIRIGPAAGKKADVVAAWCSGNASCAKCTPPVPVATTRNVEIELIPNPPVEKKVMPGQWPLPPPGVSLKPWQLVDQNGNRSFYACTK
jgi:hypothetical protein